MIADFLPYFAVFVLILAPLALTFGLMWRQRHRRGTVSPVPEKILRPAGYSLSLKLEKLNDKEVTVFTLPLLLFVLSTSPLLLFSETLGNLSLLKLILVLSGCLAAFLASLVITVIYFRSYFETYANHALGLRGEWLVAESLSGLGRDGFRIYHDYPLRDLAKGANIDHVVVGPTGVFAVETKMRRKHKKVQGNRESHRVVFDGRTLKYPTFEDRHGIDQAIANAKILLQIIRRETNLDLPVHPILVLPGWYVEQKAPAELQVVSHKVIHNRIRKSRNQLTEDEQRAVCQCIERECRDVVV